MPNDNTDDKTSLGGAPKDGAFAEDEKLAAEAKAAAEQRFSQSTSNSVTSRKKSQKKSKPAKIFSSHFLKIQVLTKLVPQSASP